MYLPPSDDLNRLFYKQLLCGTKKALHLNDVKYINCPLLPELSMKNLIPMIKGMNQVEMYLPANYTKKRTISRPFFMNIVNTVHPGFLG